MLVAKARSGAGPGLIEVVSRCTMLVFVVLLARCSGTLTNARAGRLLQSYIDERDGGAYLLDASQIAGQMGKTVTVDYTAGSPAPGSQDDIMQNLIKNGFVDKTTQTQRYPNVAGTYEGKWQDTRQGYKLTLSLSTLPGSSDVSGTSQVTLFGNLCNEGRVSGHVDTQGLLELKFTDQKAYRVEITPTPFPPPVSRPPGSGEKVTGKGQYGDLPPIAKRLIPGVGRDASLNCLVFPDQATLRFSKSGDQADLTGDTHLELESNHPLSLSGSASGPPIEVKHYTYSFPPKFQSFVASGSSAEQKKVNAGKIEVGAFDHLVLQASETSAQGGFAWKVRYNELAKILSQKDSSEGIGHATFGKQPDGGWVVTGYGLF
jgi:hypothetical protein